MSDLSSNSMSRDELIRSARANCMRQIDNPQRYTGGDARAVSGEKAPFKKSTYIRLFISCLILLFVVAVKQFNLSYQGVGFSSITEVVEDNQDFAKFQQYVANTLEENVIPVFQQVKSIGK